MSEALPHVLVMMATYNGEKYVAEQIDTILVQEGVKVTLLISDDGSTDSTPAICTDYASRFDNVHFRVNETNKRVALNFMDMLYESDIDQYDFFAFSDQDDFWLPEKLIRAVEMLAERGDTPALYYSDVLNVDSNLENGRAEYYPFKAVASNLKTLLVVNWASGCTMVFNRELARLLCEVKPEAYPRIHDTWVHLVAFTCGTVIEDLEHSYILRRITGDNQVGVSGFGELGTNRAKEAVGRLVHKTPDEERWATNQAKILLARCGDRMDEKSLKVVERFAAMPSSVKACFAAAFDPGYKQPFPLETFSIHIRLLLNMC